MIGKFTSPPISLVAPALVLLCLSLTVLLSLSRDIFLEQLLFTIVGILAFLVMTNLDYRTLLAASWVWYAVSIILLGLTIFIGASSRGSTRWLPLGPFHLQPSEFAKPLLILTAASFMTKYKPQTFLKTLKFLAIFLVPILLINRQPDLGSSLIVLIAVMGIMIIGNTPKKYLALLLAGTTVIAPLLWGSLKEYQRQRLTSFINPQADPLGAGYNALQATIAVGSGKLTGRGLGHGTQSQLKFLPEHQTDFIFAVIAEEFGFLGTTFVLSLYAWLLFAIFSITARAKDKSGQLIGVGVFSFIFAQTSINIGMNIGILPVTGITLPFISAGGSSLVATAITLGLVSNVSYNPSPPKASLEIR